VLAKVDRAAAIEPADPTATELNTARPSNLWDFRVSLLTCG